MTMLLLASCGDRDTTPTGKKDDITQKKEEPKKPSDSYMGTRMYVQWKKGITPDMYFEAIDIADIINNKSKFTASFLKEYVSFHSSTPNGGVFYEFNDEDIKNIQIHDLEYRYNQIMFYASYKTIKSNLLKLTFNMRDFYDRKFKLNQEFISKNYMRGVYEDASGNLGNIFVYDTQRYDIEGNGQSNYVDNGGNYFRMGVRVTDKKSKLSTELSKEVRGFKTLEMLANNLTITPRAEFEQLAKDRVKQLKDKNETDITTRLEAVFVNEKWMLQTDIKVENQSLLWRNDGLLTGKGAYQSGVYLENPDFIITSAIIKENDLYLKVQLRQVNKVYLGKDYDIVVRNIK